MILKSNIVSSSICWTLIVILCWGSLVSEAKTKRPAWIDTQLSHPDYYQGVGYAPKIKKQNSHIEKAKKEALNALASEISVTIFSSNVLVTLATNDKLNEEFNTLIQSRVKTDLEGYELVDTYQDKKGYWVYYRLSKSKYRALEEQKRLKASENARSNYIVALEAEEKLDFKKAIIFYTKTLDALKLYLNENFIVEVNGNNINLIAGAYEHISNIIRRLSLVTQQVIYNVKFGETLNKNQLSFQLKDNNQHTISGFPVNVYYSEKALSQTSILTDSLGKITFDIQSIRSRKATEYINLTPDIEAVLTESWADYTIRKSILSMQRQNTSVQVNISKPSIQILINSKNINTPSTDSLVYKTMEGLAIKSGYNLCKESPDFTWTANTFTEVFSQTNGIITAILKGEIQLIAKNGKVLYKTAILPIKGVQLTAEKAGEEAYKTFVKQFELRYFQEMEDAILTYHATK